MDKELEEEVTLIATREDGALGCMIVLAAIVFLILLGKVVGSINEDISRLNARICAVEPACEKGK